MKKVIIILALLFAISLSCYAQVVDTLYSYDVLHYLPSIKDMNQKDYEPTLSVRYDVMKNEFKDSTSIDIDFKSNGCMSFKKYFNGVLYLEGGYNSSDSSEIQESQGIDPITDELLEPVLNRIYYPTKCGEWRFYLNEDVQERIVFKKCNCQ